jgi:hypothetical protein
MPPPAGKEPVAQITAAAGSSSSAVYAAAPSTRAAYYPSTAVPDPSDHVWAHHFNMLNSAEAGSSSAMGGGGPSSYDPSRATTSSRDEASLSVSNASDMEAAEWIEEDEPGVCLTIRELGDGTRELRRIRFRYTPRTLITNEPLKHHQLNFSRPSCVIVSDPFFYFCGFAAGRGSARRGQRNGGSRTETGFRRSTCRKGKQSSPCNLQA